MNNNFEVQQAIDTKNRADFCTRNIAGSVAGNIRL